MSDIDRNEAVKFAALLDEFAAAQRGLALAETRKQRIMVGRHVGDQNITYEVVVDEGASSADIFRILEPLDGAIDRLKAKADLSDHYSRIANHLGQIEMSMKKLAADRIKFQAENAQRNERGRRTPLVLTGPQKAGLDGHRQAIRDGFGRIEELQKAAAECRRVLGGEDPFQVLDDVIAAKLDELRGARQDAA